MSHSTFKFESHSILTILPVTVNQEVGSSSLPGGAYLYFFAFASSAAGPLVTLQPLLIS